MAVGVGVNRQRLALLATTALTAVALAARMAAAQDATWLANPGNGNFADSANWSPATVPSGTAIFGASTVTTVNIDNVGNIGALQLDAGTPAYTFNLSNNMAFVGAGIVNNSAQAPVLNVDGTGFVALYGSASLANATIVNNGGGFISIRDNSSGGTARYIGNGGQLNTDAVTTGTTLGSIEGSGALQFGNKRLTVGGNNLSTTFDGFLVGFGAGRFIKEGTGTLVLTANNIINGGTTITGGLINFGTLDNFGSGSVTLDGGGVQWRSGTSADISGRLNALGASGGTFDTNGNDVILASTISGTGGLAKAGTGTLTLSAANTYTGATAINDGTLQIGNGGTTGSVASTSIVNNATLAFNRSDTLAVGAAISGSGTVVQAGTGTTVLTAANSYTGGTVVNAGTLQLGAGGSLASTGALTINGGTFDLNGRFQTVGTLSGSGGAIALGSGGLTTDTATSSTLASVIGGTGSLVKQGIGTLTLTGDSSGFSGITMVSGGALQIGSGGTTGALGDGEIVNNAALAVNRSNDLTMANRISGTGSFTKAGTNTLTLGGDMGGFTGTTTIAGGGLTLTNTMLGGNVVNNGTLTTNLSGFSQVYVSSISGTGSLVQTGSELTFTGANTYTGGTTINGGLIRVGVVGGATGSIVGTVNVANGGDLYLLNADTSGMTTVTVDASAVLFGGATSAGSATYTQTGFGSISFIDSSTAGTATLNNVVAGLLNFTGTSSAGSATITNGGTMRIANNASGGTARYIGVTGGSLEIAVSGAGTTLGSIEGGSSIRVTGKELAVGSNNLSTTFSGVIFGSGGSVVKEGTGTLSLRANNTYTAGTTVTGGLVNFAALNNFGTGNVTLNGGGLQWATGTTTDISGRLNALGASGGIFDTNSNNITLANGMSGSGSLTKAGLGTLTLTGDSTYAGATTISGGTLQIGNGGTTGSLGTGAVVNNASLVVNRSDNTTMANDQSGTGGFTKLGTGRLTLTGINSHTGGTTIAAGTLQIGDGVSGEISGPIVNNATLALNMAGATLAGPISGTGAVRVVGGDNTLTGSHSYTGGTTVAAGSLQLGIGGGASGALAGAVTVNGFGSLDVANADLSGVTLTNNAFTFFSNASTAGNATVTNNGAITFQDASTAGSAILDNTGFGSLLSFADNSSAGTATVTTGGASLTQFTGTASGGTARFIVNAGGQLDFSGLAAGTTAGSIEGNGSVSLGANALTVGGNNRSTVFGGTMSGAGGALVKTGTGTLTVTGDSTYTGGTTISGGTLQVGNGGTSGSLGSGAIVNNAALVVDRSNDLTMSNAMSGTGSFTKAGGNALTLGGDVSGFTGTTTIAGGTLALTGTMTGGDIVNNGTLNVSLSGAVAIYGGSVSGTGRLVHSGSQLILTGANTYTGGTFIGAGGGIFVGLPGAAGSIVGAVTVTGGSGLFLGNADMSGVTTVTADASFIGIFNDSSAGTATYTLTNGSVARFQGTGTAAASTLNINSGRAEFLDDSSAGSATIVNRSFTYFRGNSSGSTARYITNGGILDISGLIATGTSIGSIEGAGLILLGSKQLTVGTNNLSTSLAGFIQGSGSLVKVGTGTLALTGGSTYTGGTTITGGLINFNALSNFGTGNVTLNGGGVQWAAGNTADISARLNALGAGGGTVDTNGNNVTFANGLSGAGGLTKAGLGQLTLAGNNTYTGGTVLTGGTLAVTGSMVGPMTVNGGLFRMNGTTTGTVTLGGTGTLGGNGTIGGLAMTSGTVAPGNSIGTLNIAGNFVQSGGVYQVEVNAQGQSDRINATGTATITGGTVSVVAQSGTYARNTTYTILNATGGVTGAYSNVTSNFAFLTPSLSYDANNVFLSLAASSSAFASGAQTPNQRAVGTALDLAVPSATGDFATVIGALSVLNTVQGPAALNAISGQNYSGFSNGLVQTGLLFMSNFSAQAGGANRVGGANAAGRGGRVEMAEACDVACEPAAAGTWGVWGGGIGAIGSIAGNGNSSAMNYNLGGFAGGLDRQITPEMLLGFTLGYSAGTQSTQGFTGSGTSDTVQAGLYASFLKGPFYLDGLAGYAYSANQMTRQIVIPGLAPRTANGSAGANQFFGQVEAGYRVDIGGMADAYVTPFVRLQGSTAMQNGFTESGAGSLNLSIAPQTTNSLRSVIGAQIGGAMDMGWREKLSVQLKLGWSHEFASTDRPVTAAFAGAPAIPFTTYGAAPNRDGVVVGFNAGTAVAERTSIYLRYEGNISGADNMHSATVGLRMTW